MFSTSYLEAYLKFLKLENQQQIIQLVVWIAEKLFHPLEIWRCLLDNDENGHRWEHSPRKPGAISVKIIEEELFIKRPHLFVKSPLIKWRIKPIFPHYRSQIKWMRFNSIDRSQHHLFLRWNTCVENRKMMIWRLSLYDLSLGNLERVLSNRGTPQSLAHAPLAIYHWLFRHNLFYK